MVSMQDPRNLRSNSSISNLAPIASDPEQILRGTDETSFYTKFRKYRYAVSEPAITLKPP